MWIDVAFLTPGHSVLKSTYTDIDAVFSVNNRNCYLAAETRSD